MSMQNKQSEPLTLGALLAQIGAAAEENTLQHSDSDSGSDDNTTEAAHQAALEAADLEALRDAQGAFKSDDVPWFVKAMYGFAAWLAAITTTLFLIPTGIFSSSGGPIVLGIMALVVSTAIVRSITTDIGSIFVQQGLLAASIVGRILLLIGLVITFRSNVHVESIASIFAVIELVLFLANDDKIHRFVSVLIGSVAMFAITQRQPQLLQIMVGVWALGCAAVWLPSMFPPVQGWSERVLTPLRYGLAITLMVTLAWTTHPKAALMLKVDTWIMTTVALVLVLAWTCKHITDRHQLEWTPPNIALASGLGVLSLCAFNAPGVIGAGLLFALANESRDRLFQVLSVLCFGYYLSALYYNLSISLFYKSIALIIPGAGLLLLRYLYLRSATPTHNAEVSHA